MADIMNIGSGGVMAYRASLAVTSENIANVDTEGYRRRTAVLQESGTGTGVDVVEIRRAFDTLLASRSRNAESGMNAAETYMTHIQALEDRMLPGVGGVPDLLNGFFDALDGLSAAPADQGLRQAVLGSGEALAGGIANLAKGLDALEQGVAEETAQAVVQTNTLLEDLAKLQDRLAETTDPVSRNPLRDHRDNMLTDLAKLIDVSVELDDAGRATVRLGSDGSGPVLLSKARAGMFTVAETGTLTVQPANRDEPAVTRAVSGGVLGGLADATGALAQALVDIDSWAGTMVDEINAVHATGLTADGIAGGPLFSLAGWDVAPAGLMRGTGAAEVTISDAEAMPEGPLTLVYDAATAFWQARDAADTVLAEGREMISLSGMRIDLTGTPMNGDRINLSRSDGATRNMAFVQTDPDLIAASGSLTVSADPLNAGSATISASRVTASDSGQTDLSTLLGGETVEFLTAGVVGVVPAGSTSALLAAEPRYATMEFTVDDSALPLSLSLTTASGPVGFDLSSTADLQAAVDALNAGTLLADTEQTLGDLGLVAELGTGTISLMARDGAVLPGAASLTTDLGSAAGAVVADAAPAADLSVFTRDGRQLSGPPLSAAEAAALITTDNGFYADAVYTTDYLNGAAAFGLLEQSRMSATGDYTTLLGQSGGLESWSGSALPAEAAGAEIGFEADGQSLSLTLPTGASAAWQAQALAEALPVMATADTRAALTLPSSGKLSLELTGKNGAPVTVSADLDAGGPEALRSAINAQSAATGIRAELSPDGARMVLVQESGLNITLAGLSDSSGEGMTITRLAPDGSALGSVALGAGGDDAARITGTVTLTGANAFGVTEDGLLQTAARDGFSSGLMTRESAAAGSAVTLTPSDPVATDLTLRAITVTGADGRLHSAEADPVTAASGADLAAALAADLRATAPASRITGTALAALPADGAQMRVTLGEQTYAIQMSDGAPLVSGPEAGRVVASFDASNRLVIETVGGDLNGAALTLPVDSGEAARFGLGTADAPVTTLIGQPYDAADLPASFTLSVGGTDYDIAVTDGGVTLPAGFPGAARIDGTLGQVEIDIDARAGLVEIPAQSGAAAAGFDTLGASASVADGALRLTATDGRVLQVSSTSTGTGAAVALNALADEDLLVVMSDTGALRLSGEITAGTPEQTAQEVRVLDAETRLVGLYDADTGAQLATRTLDAAGGAQFGTLSITLSGSLATGDSFAIAPGGAGAGDSTTLEALANLRQQDGTTGRGGYAADFAGMQQRVGAQVSAARISTNAARAELDSATQLDAQLGAVDLDQEAARMMQQMQAYQANAQVMTVAGQLFDTLLNAM